MIESTRPGSTLAHRSTAVLIAGTLAMPGVLVMVALLMLALPVVAAPQRFSGQSRASTSNANTLDCSRAYGQTGAASLSLGVGVLAKPTGVAPAPAVCSSLRFANPYIYSVFRQPGAV